ncbi:hypothetical protein [Bradyrhizobium sp. 930_D9_N1_4]
MQTILDIIIFVAGFATCWFCRDPVVRLVTGTDALIKSLEARLAILRAKS